MIRVRDPMEYQKWAVLGSDLKKMRKQVMSILTNSELQGHLTLKQMEPLMRSLRGIDVFRSNAEDQMFRELHHRYKEPRDLFGVFYGDKDLEPCKEPELYEGY